MRKISSGVISVMIMMVMLCGSAYADIVYLTDSGALGRISTFDADSADLRGTQYTTSWNDPFLGSYWNGSRSRVILVDRNTDKTTSGDTALIFDPSDLSSPIEAKRTVLNGVYSAQAMAGSDNGRAVFFASEQSIHEFSTSDFSLTRSYTYIPKTSEDITAEITELITGTNVIYVLVKQDISSDIVLGFDGQLREDVSGSFQRKPLLYETSAISWLNGTRVAAGHEYGVDVWNDNRGFLGVLSTDAPVKAVCQDSGSGFYFIEQSEAEDTYTTTLKHYDSREGVSTLFMNTEGRICRFVRDKDNGIIAAIVGDELLLYRMDSGILIGEYDSSELGGIPVQIAASVVTGKDNKSSSGCSVAGMGMLLILAAGCMFLKRYGI